MLRDGATSGTALEALPSWVAGERRDSEARDPRAFQVAGYRATRARAEQWAQVAAALTRPGPRLTQELLGETVRRLLARAAGAPTELANALGLSSGEPVESLGTSEARLTEAIAPFGAGLTEPGGGRGFLILAHWSEGVRVAERLLRVLHEGWVPVVISDPRLPQAASWVLEALDAALGHGDVALGFSGLHDDGLELLRVAASSGLPLWGLENDGRLRFVHSAASPPTPGTAASAPAPIVWHGPLYRAPGRRRTAVVREGEDPREAARQVAARAALQSATLSGQLPGHVGRVLCHERRFSAFTTELLEALEALGPGLPLIDSAMLDTVREACARGLDEGACMISGGEPAGLSTRRSGAARAPRDPGLTVFTNVDPARGLARHQLPCPVLALSRVESDASGVALQRALDDPKHTSPF